MESNIVLVSGALATPKFWQHQEAVLIKRHHIHHVNSSSDDCIIKMAKNFAKEAPDSFNLIGFSMGGYIALELFNHIPHKIKKLILINSGAKLMSEKGVQERERSLELIRQGKFDLLVKLLFKNSVHGKNHHTEIFSLLRTMAYETGAENYQNQLTAMLNKPDHSQLLSEIKCPVLLLVSKDDQIMPPHWSEHLANHIPGAKLVHLENTGHMAPLEQYGLVNQHIEDWL